MSGQQIPVEPTRITVLAVSVIVAALTTSHLVAHYKHGHTNRKEGGGEKVLYLPVAQPLYFGIVRRALDAAVPASVLLAATIAELIVPFLPAISHEAADLVKSCRVPCLRNHLGTG